MALELPRIISEHIQCFTGRTWLLPPLLTWLEESENRIFILKGQPGTGKSMITAWLAGAAPSPVDSESKRRFEHIRAHVKAAHFCIETSGNASPKEFAWNMAKQLTQNVRGFGDALVATLGPQFQINVIQNINTVESEARVSGVSIHQLDLGFLHDEFSFNLILREPLKKLYKSGLNEPIILLVDALDEALTYTGNINIVQLLARLDDLPSPVRFLVTTRPDRRVLRRFTNARLFDLTADAPDVQDDVHRYTYEMLDALPASHRDKLAGRISHAAKGNFLYANLVIADLKARLPKAPDLEAIHLPSGLAEAYHSYLNRELGDHWLEVFKPVLGLIAVARGEGLSRAQIERILGKDVESALQKCQQYLEGQIPDGPFRLFHKSFTDFLLEDHKNRDYRIDAAKMNRQIVDHYWEAHSKNWENCKDDYGLRHLAVHIHTLSQVATAPRQDEQSNLYRLLLYKLICGSFMWAKYNWYGSHQPFSEDLELAIEASLSEKPQNFVQMARGYYIYSRLAWMATKAPPSLLGSLARMGRADEAQGFAAMMQDPAQQCEAYCFIGEALISQELKNEGARCLASAWMSAEAIDTSISYRDKAPALAEVARIMAKAGDRDGLEKVAKSAEAISDSTSRVEVYSSLASAYSTLGEMGKASELTHLALTLVESIQDGRKSGSLVAVAKVAIQLRDERGKDRVLSLAQALNVKHGLTWTLHAITQTLKSSGEELKAKEVADLTLAAAGLVSGPSEKATSLMLAAQALALAGESEKAKQATIEALTAVRMIQDLSSRVRAIAGLSTEIWEMGEKQLARDAAIESLEISREITDLSSGATEETVRALAKVGAKDELWRLLEDARRIKRGVESELLLSGLAEGMAEIGEFDAAFETARVIRSEVFRSGALRKIAKSLAKDGELKKSLIVARELEYQDYKIDLLSWLAQFMFDLGKDDLAAQAAELALSEVEKATLGGTVKARALGEIAKALMLDGNLDHATKVALHALTEVRHQSEGDIPIEVIQSLAQVGELDVALALAKKSGSVEKMIEVAQELDKAGMRQRAVDITNQALAWANNGSISRASTVKELCAVTQTLVSIGESQWACEIANQARSIGLEIEGETQIASAFSYIAQALTKTGYHTLAVEAARRSLDAARLIPTKYLDVLGILSANATVKAVNALVQVEENELAMVALTQLLEEAERSAYPSQIDAAAQAAGEVYDLESMERVRALAERLPDGKNRAVALIQVSRALSKMGEYGQVLECLHKYFKLVPMSSGGFMQEMLGVAAPAIASLDKGQTLWRVYEAMLEIDGWWESR